ncbi:D-aminoacid aminotransferase-like PLP-dependent enzyme [Ophiobolus disseminans]|uniref:D-aminoacid aminotransferase-like PLP-dependent enzyme n=1 Tax=Ophiobolus disseminans TaxID=1469910 RepID=A0A6A7A588_9PLEO|nr:D-aminoacid aminotransferase-like PLP-dependent enzyme [Ophiobolus disseminans]
MTTMNTIFAGYESRLNVLSQSTNPLSKGIAYIQGDLVPLQEARIPLMDQGFLRSDLTYDVPAVWDGRFFRLDEHIARLDTSCKKMRLRLPIPAQEIKAVLIDMVAKSGIRDAFVELIVTRGMRQVRGAKPEELLNNHLYMLVMPYVWVMPPAMQIMGGKAVVARTVRRTPPGSMDPTIKNLQWGDFTRGLFEAADRGAVYPFLTDGDANLTEGAGFNIVLVKDGVLYTPDRGVLEGITRKTVCDVARQLGIEVKIQVVPVQMAYEADEVFMCTTAGGVMPITVLDGAKIRDGTVGVITSKIWDGYWALHRNDELSFEVQYPRNAGEVLAKL